MTWAKINNNHLFLSVDLNELKLLVLPDGWLQTVEAAIKKAEYANEAKTTCCM